MRCVAFPSSLYEKNVLAHLQKLLYSSLNDLDGCTLDHVLLFNVCRFYLLPQHPSVSKLFFTHKNGRKIMKKNIE